MLKIIKCCISRKICVW